MGIEPEKLSVKANATESVTALLYPAAKDKRVGITIILGHGAGASQLSGFMQLFAHGLNARGIDVMTFNFVYMEQQRTVPDQKAKLEGCFQAVIEAAAKHQKLKNNKIVIGGKSMGGRIASQVAADQSYPLVDKIAGLVYLGYPLHPPGAPTRLRVEHWPSIKAPMLFVQGTRDALGTPDEIKPYLKEFKMAAKIFTIEGGDHSFKAPKKLGIAQNEIYDNAMNEILDWVKNLK